MGSKNEYTHEGYLMCYKETNNAPRVRIDLGEIATGEIVDGVADTAHVHATYFFDVKEEGKKVEAQEAALKVLGRVAKIRIKHVRRDVEMDKITGLPKVDEDGIVQVILRHSCEKCPVVEGIAGREKGEKVKTSAKMEKLMEKAKELEANSGEVVL